MSTSRSSSSEKKKKKKKKREEEGSSCSGSQTFAALVEMCRRSPHAGIAFLALPPTAGSRVAAKDCFAVISPFFTSGRTRIRMRVLPLGFLELAPSLGALIEMTPTRRSALVSKAMAHVQELTMLAQSYGSKLGAASTKPRPSGEPLIDAVRSYSWTLPSYYAPALREALAEWLPPTLIVLGGGVRNARHRMPSGAHSVVEKLQATQSTWMTQQHALRGPPRSDHLRVLDDPPSQKKDLRLSLVRVLVGGVESAATLMNSSSGLAMEASLSSVHAVRWRYAVAGTGTGVGIAAAAATAAAAAAAAATASPSLPAATNRRKLGLTAAVADRHCLSIARMGDMRRYRAEKKSALRAPRSRELRDAVRSAILESDVPFKGRLASSPHAQKRRRFSQRRGSGSGGSAHGAAVGLRVDEVAALGPRGSFSSSCATAAAAAALPTLKVERCARLVAATSAVERGLARWHEAVALLRRPAAADAQLRRCATALNAIDAALTRTLLRRAVELHARRSAVEQLREACAEQE